MPDYLICALCSRQTPLAYVEKHHLTPRAKGGKETEKVCSDCGNMVHQLFTNNELRDTYNTIEALKSNPSVQRWIRWIQKRSFGVCMKAKKKK